MPRPAPWLATVALGALGAWLAAAVLLGTALHLGHGLAGADSWLTAVAYAGRTLVTADTGAVGPAAPWADLLAALAAWAGPVACLLTTVWLWGGAARRPDERRAHARHRLASPVPALFGPPGRSGTAGRLIDVSEGGARIAAPPGTAAGFGEILLVSVALRDAAGESLAGFSLPAQVVRSVADADGTRIQVRFDRRDGEWEELRRWLERLRA
ncbi:MAG: PilZ domain-containing protein [Myxococcota bacterium]